MSEYVVNGGRPMTSVAIDRNTRSYLEQLKMVPQEPVNNVIKRMVEGLAVQCKEQIGEMEAKKNGLWSDEEGRLSPQTINLIKTRLNRISEGRVLSTAELKQRLRQRRDHEIRRCVG